MARSGDLRRIAYHRRMRRRSLSFFGGACCALVLSAGCSGGDGSSAGSGTAEPNVLVDSDPVPAIPLATLPLATIAVPTTTATLPLPTAAPTSATLTGGGDTTTSAPAVTAESLAVEITAAERGIRDVTLTADGVAAFGRRQQQVYQLLARNAGLLGAVTALMPADVAVAFGLNVAARQAVVDHAAGTVPSEPSATLPAWTIVPPRPIGELLDDYREAEAATGVPWEYLAAINLVETRMGRIRGESSAGALGPMQFLPTTWAACCTGDIEDPHDAIVGAALYLRSQGAPGDMPAALYGYNPNEGYVGAVTAYASNLMADPLAYNGYHAWEVYVGSAAGTIRLPVGYSAAAPIDAVEYAREHPRDVT